MAAGENLNSLAENPCSLRPRLPLKRITDLLDRQGRRGNEEGPKVIDLLRTVRRAGGDGSFDDTTTNYTVAVLSSSLSCAANSRPTGRFSARCRPVAGLLFVADISPRSSGVHYRGRSSSRLTVLSRLMDSAFARDYRTLGQFYGSRLVHAALFSPGPDPSNGGANSVFTDNGRAARKYSRGPDVDLRAIPLNRERRRGPRIRPEVVGACYYGPVAALDTRARISIRERERS